MNSYEETEKEGQREEVSEKEGWLNMVFLIAIWFLIYFLGYVYRHG